jgi:hypothetical protein
MNRPEHLNPYRDESGFRSPGQGGKVVHRTDRDPTEWLDLLGQNKACQTQGRNGDATASRQRPALLAEVWVVQ